MKITKLLVAALLLVVSSLCFYGCEGEPEPQEPKLDEFQLVITNEAWGLNFTGPIIKTRGAGTARVDEPFIFDYDGEEHVVGGVVLRNGQNTGVRTYCGEIYDFDTKKSTYGNLKKRGKFECTFETDLVRGTSGNTVALSMYITIIIQ